MTEPETFILSGEQKAEAEDVAQRVFAFLDEERHKLLLGGFGNIEAASVVARAATLSSWMIASVARSHSGGVASPERFVGLADQATKDFTPEQATDHAREFPVIARMTVCIERAGSDDEQ